MLASFFCVLKQMDENHCKERKISTPKYREGTPLFKKDGHFWTCDSASPKTKHFWGHFLKVLLTII